MGGIIVVGAPFADREAPEVDQAVPIGNGDFMFKHASETAEKIKLVINNIVEIPTPVMCRGCRQQTSY